MLWHFLLDHPNFQYMKHLFRYLFSKIDVSILSCDVCIQVKQHRVSFPSQPYKPTHPFALVDIDVWGPSKITTSFGKQWLVTFIDEHTRLTWVFLVSDKSEVTSVFRDFYHTVETQFNTKIAILRCDSGRKFQNHTLNEFVFQSHCSLKFLHLHWPTKWSSRAQKPSPFGSRSFSYVVYFPSFLSLGRCCSHCSLSYQPNAFSCPTCLDPLRVS